MSGNRSVPDALILDSFASLRIADRMVREFDAAATNGDGRLHQDTLAQHRLLVGAHREIAGMLASLKQSRFILEHTTLERIQRSQEKQLEYASSVLGELEERMSALVGAFEGIPGLDPVTEEEPAGKPTAPVVFDPLASTRNAPERQALADEIFIDTGAPDEGPSTA